MLRHRSQRSVHASTSYLFISDLCQQVGVAVKGDGKRLQRDYGVETRGMVDLRSHARACWVDLPCRSLAGITSTVLGKFLCKDPAVRFSSWSKPVLAFRHILPSLLCVLSHSRSLGLALSVHVLGLAAFTMRRLPSLLSDMCLRT